MIYPLPPEELDDKTLDKNIRAIAQVLCNVHHVFEERAYEYAGEIGATIPGSYKNFAELIAKIPLSLKENYVEFTDWGLACRANYERLVYMGLACCREYEWRFSEFEYADENETDQEGNIIDAYSKIVGAKELKEHKLQPVIEWARDNVPDLPRSYTGVLGKTEIHSATPFPLVMPAEFRDNMWSYIDCSEEIKEQGRTESYRNYYHAKLPKNAQWTRREKPGWLKQETTMILTLEQQVASLELSERLKELGCPQKTLFYWVKVIGQNKWDVCRLDEFDKSYFDYGFAVSAYTVAEIFEMMSGSGWGYLRKNLTKSGDLYEFGCITVEHEWDAIAGDKNLANAAAKTAIFLLEIKLAHLNI